MQPVSTKNNNRILYNFIKDANYERSKKMFYFKIKDLKLKETIQDLPDYLYW